jgi:hypothetical protein
VHHPIAGIRADGNRLHRKPVRPVQGSEDAMTAAFDLRMTAKNVPLEAMDAIIRALRETDVEYALTSIRTDNQEGHL